jgi:hypothetical protein
VPATALPGLGGQLLGTVRNRGPIVRKEFGEWGEAPVSSAFQILFEEVADSAGMPFLGRLYVSDVGWAANYSLESNLSSVVECLCGHV